MPLSENELKQIEQEAKSWAASMITGLPVNNERAWEEIYKAISKHQAEKYQNEVDALRVGKQYWIEGSKQVLKNRDEYEKYLKDQLASRDSELRELREVAIKAEDAIEQLLSFQNGSPLPTYDKGWKLGCELCENWLAAYRKIKPEIKP